MSKDEITIVLADKNGRVTADGLRAALQEALDMLRAIESQVIEPDADVQWEVKRVQMKSPLSLTIAPQVTVRGKKATSRVKQKLVRAATMTVKGLEKGRTDLKYADEETLAATRRLVKSATTDGGFLSFESDGTKITLTSEAIVHIDQITEKSRSYMDFMTVEGRLEIISVHEHNSFFIWESLTGHKIECLGSAEHLRNAVNLLGERVAITGRISFKNHIPKKMYVEEPIRRLRSKSELPQLVDIPAIDLTDGLSSERHVRKMRDA